MKRLFLFFYLIILFAFTRGDSKSLYTIPQAPATIFSTDIDFDGDIDVFFGHNYSSNSDWGGVSLLQNQNNGYFDLSDSCYFENGFLDIGGNYFDNNESIDLFSRTVTSDPYSINISIIYNYGLSQFDSIKSFPLYPEPPVPFITSGDVNGDGFPDLLFAHNNDQLWGIIYNDGTGIFSEPEYYYVSGYWPLDIKCSDLNGDGRDDVVICGSETEIYFSTSSGFQQKNLTSTLSHDILISDFDNDGDNDILTHTTFIYPNHRVYIFENTGNNEFIEHDYFQFSPFCQYGKTTDFNNDSLPDLIFSAQDNSGLHIYYNQGNFQLGNHLFIPIETNSAMLRRVDCADFDANNYNDIVLIKSWGAPYEGNTMFLFNDGLGNFVDNPLTFTREMVYDNSLTCFPNPFITQVNFTFKLNKKSEVVFNIYDIQGKLVFNSTPNYEKPGKYSISWDGKDMCNAPVKPGNYIAVLKLNEYYYKSIKIIKQ